MMLAMVVAHARFAGFWLGDEDVHAYMIELEPNSDMQSTFLPTVTGESDTQCNHYGDKIRRRSRNEPSILPAEVHAGKEVVGAVDAIFTAEHEREEGRLTRIWTLYATLVLQFLDGRPGVLAIFKALPHGLIDSQPRLARLNELLCHLWRYGYSTVCISHNEGAWSHLYFSVHQHLNFEREWYY
jgi:hypothetical protein